MRLKITIVLLLTFMVNFGQENQSEKNNFTISGSVDTYFRTNITGPNTASQTDEETVFLNPGTSFANRNGFSFGMANPIISYEGNKVGFVADFVFGPRGEEAVFLSNPSTNFINQLYVYWDVADKLRLTLGNFNTFLGYEVISPTGNFNYSTSYMFSNGPFSHIGLKADYNVTDDLSLMLAVMNSTDYTEINLDGSYTIGSQIGYKGQFLNLIYGNQTNAPDATFQIDYTGGFNATEFLYMGINTTYNDTNGEGFYGAALYPQYTLSETLILGLRGEYFGVRYNESENQTVLAGTLSANYKIDNLTIIPEVRLDTWSDDIYLNNLNNPSNQLASFLVAAVYELN